MRGDKSSPHTLCSPLLSSSSSSIPSFLPTAISFLLLAVPFSFLFYYRLFFYFLSNPQPPSHPRCHPRSALVVFLCTAWLLIITHSLFLWLMALLEGDPAPYGRQAASVMASAIRFLPFHMCLSVSRLRDSEGNERPGRGTRDFSSTRFSGDSSSQPALYPINMINHGVQQIL